MALCCLPARAGENRDIIELSGILRQSLSWRGRSPDLKIAGTEGTRTAQEIVFPHAIKPVVITTLQYIPIPVKVAEPGNKGLIIIITEIMPILHHKQILSGCTYLFH
jgi:hypothetical protein